MRCHYDVAKQKNESTTSIWIEIDYYVNVTVGSRITTSNRAEQPRVRGTVTSQNADEFPPDVRR